MQFGTHTVPALDRCNTGMSLVAVQAPEGGLSRQALKKDGRHNPDTAALYPDVVFGSEEALVWAHNPGVCMDRGESLAVETAPDYP